MPYRAAAACGPHSISTDPCCAASTSSSIEDDVRWLGKILGRHAISMCCRSELLDPAIEALGEAEQLAPLLASLAVKKASAYEQVSEALVSARYRYLLIDLCALGHADDLGRAGAERPRPRPAAFGIGFECPVQGAS